MRKVTVWIIEEKYHDEDWYPRNKIFQSRREARQYKNFMLGYNDSIEYRICPYDRREMKKGK